MKNILYALFLAFLVACGGNSAQTKKAGQATDTTADKLYIKDPLQYTQSFINQVRATNYPDKVQLVDSIMTIGKDTAVFPTILKAGKMYYFKGGIGRRFFALTVIRINYSTIDYDFTLTKQGMTEFLSKGQASISPEFYKASEEDKDNEEGSNYGAALYTSTENGCNFTIRIGLDKDGKGRLRAKIAQQCSNQNVTIPLDDCPVLRSE